MNYLGVDVGSVSVAVIVLNSQGEIVYNGYRFHRGNILSCIKEELSQINLSEISQIAFNQNAAEFFCAGKVVNEQIAAIEGIKRVHPEVRSLFTIGGETFGLFLFDADGNYQKLISNSSCAAGTGSFLDQQAERLGLADSAELSRLAGSFKGDPPKIATRCAVFAKTDLIHSQQQGYSLAAISTGLCQGLAQNIADTLSGGIQLHEPVLAIGGVSKNSTVIEFLSKIIKTPINIPDFAPNIDALGCAILASQQDKNRRLLNIKGLDTLLRDSNSQKNYFFPPLISDLTGFPDFKAHRQYIANEVEVDIYNLSKPGSQIKAYLGIDIGSTSTKVVLAKAGSDKENILLGLYTRTKGQPIKAVQALLRTLRNIEQENDITFEFIGVGTTGSGRKLVKKVINADLAVDEITAHARSAVELNPDVDTIIEIGGQDAKFTLLKNGNVIFSVMNYVCAAGTGSFIEEQAKRLNVSLEEYADRAFGAQSPLTSDRCTVFMERDLNHFLSRGYGKDELLAATLHSVRDNYLSKVAHQNKIGKVIYFQGATAKNKALVAAFEQKLQKPIFVSRYCHLTGALGVCLMLQEQKIIESSFRGLNFCDEVVTVNDDVCELCKNHCKLKEVEVSGEIIVWGYLCGREEQDKHRKSHYKSAFDLLSSRRHIFKPPPKEEFLPVKERKSLLEEIKDFDFEKSVEKLKNIQFDFSLDHLPNVELDRSLTKVKENFSLNLLYLRHKIFTAYSGEPETSNHKKKVTIGLPNALYMTEYIPFWRFFFNLLGYPVVISSFKEEYLGKGKEISGAEFCAPMSNWHGHVQSILERCDYIFLPHMLVDGEMESPKFLCHFSNYASTIIQNLDLPDTKEKFIDPLINFSKPPLENIRVIYESLPDSLKLIQDPSDIQIAFHKAWSWFGERRSGLTEIFTRQHDGTKDISVVFLGRPYIILDPVMNKNIPHNFNELGVKTYFQDMIPYEKLSTDKPGKELIDWNHWKFGDSILKTAETVATIPGLFPVFLTAFKCAPDAFVLTYFKEIMDAYDKPYLILQLDEHGSGVGYETRIESAVRSFKNHIKKPNKSAIKRTNKKVHLEPLDSGDLLIPNFDPLASGLMCAAFNRAGYKARLIEESSDTVSASLRLNDGQCLPISSIVQGAIDMVEKYHLNPETTSLFINAITNMACNFPQYPLMAKKLLEQRGDGFEQMHIFATEFDMRRMPFELVFDVYTAYLLGGFLRKMACKIRPYEIMAGQTDLIIDKGYQKLFHHISQGLSREDVFKEIVDELAAVPVDNTFGQRPKTVIIGDMYVRDNDIFNQNLIHELEANGAEVESTPLSYVIRMLAVMRYYGLKVEGRYFSFMKNRIAMEILEAVERRFFQIANVILKEEFPVYDSSILDELKKYKISLRHGGETAQNVIKIFNTVRQYPELALIIHVNPIFCCAGLVSESVFKAVEKDIGIPIVSLTYDGTKTKRNEALAPYLHFIKNRIPKTKSENVQSNNLAI